MSFTLKFLKNAKKLFYVWLWQNFCKNKNTIPFVRNNYSVLQRFHKIFFVIG